MIINLCSSDSMISLDQRGQAGSRGSWLQKSQFFSSGHVDGVQPLEWDAWFPAPGQVIYVFRFYTCTVKVVMVFTSEGCCEMSVGSDRESAHLYQGHFRDSNKC